MSLSKLGLKLSLLSSALVLGVIGMMANRLLGASRDAFLAEKRARAEAFARSCREAVFPKVDAFALHFTLGELMQEPGMVYAQVMDTDGKVLSHSDSARVGERDETPQGKTALAASATILQTYTGKDGVEYLDVSVPVLARTKHVGAVRLGITRRSLEAALEPEKRRVFAIAAVAVLAATLGTVLLVGWLTRPLPMLAAAAREIGRGKLDTRVEWKSTDEIGSLARSFNEMAVANQLAFAALKEEKEKLDTIFSETRDGLILTDPGGRFLLINPTARRLLGFGDSSLTPMNSPVPGVTAAFKEFETEPAVESLIQATDRVMNFELRRKEPKLLILAGTRDRLETTRGSAGLLWVFRDATFEKREEVLSRSILSLISHKLKTPLMACIGYLEILAKDPPQLEGFHKKAFESMTVQHQRLSGMVEKLLFFASVYSPDMLVLNRRQSDALPLAQHAVEQLGDTIASTGAHVVVDEDALDSAPKLNVDCGRVEEALRNLIENAIKFNPKPEKQVKVSAEAAGKWVTFSVKDNGPGIPAEEHPRLFRKFYQMEDSFTGQIDGMGLGLAFVKNIAEAHGGEAYVKSAPGRGAEFFLALPRADSA
ncbi:MAG: HAMP domain-containing protein [Elusimicrobia bacterium]|nr:HAMP domain-containing protein [Elusimicrobiota bacterium]